MPLAERMAHYKVPGVSIAVIDSGRVVWARGFGVKEAGDGRFGHPRDALPGRLDQQAGDRDRACSGWCEEGTLSLDENMNAYLKSWQLPDNPFTAPEKVTLRRIAQPQRRPHGPRLPGL